MIDLAQMVQELVELPVDSEPQLPHYGTKGRILVEYWWGWDDHDILDYDADTSVFWLHEHGLIEHLVLGELELEIHEDAVFEIEVTAHYHKGDGWMTDDDISVEIGRIQRTDKRTLL